MEITNGSEVYIDDITSNGKGISRINDMVVMTDNALPGQTVKIRIIKKRRKYIEAKIVDIVKRSELEKENVFQQIPGAPWIYLQPEIQKEYKYRQIKELFSKYTSINISAVFEYYIESPQLFEYRNKMEYSFGFTEEAYIQEEKKFHKTGFGLGSRKKGSFILVEDLIKPSGIFDIEFERLIPTIKQFCFESGLPPYDTKRNHGFFRYLRVRKSFFEDAFLIALYGHSDYSKQFDDDGFYQCLLETLKGRLKGFSRENHDNVSDAGMEKAEVVYQKGENYLIEKINGLEFQISKHSFFQTNPKCAQKLYETVIEYCKGIPGGIILDLYCGTGTMSRILRSKFNSHKVIGVEAVADAIADAQKNSSQDQDPVQFYCADVKHFLADFRRPEEALTVVANPPRAGIDPKPLDAIIKLKPENLIYVSCNPATLARDSEILHQAAYRLSSLTAVDQFPHTPHVECIAKFVL